MDFERHMQVTKKQLPWDINYICCMLGVAGALSCPMVNAANQIVRTSAYAFGIPNDVAERVLSRPAITTIDGKKYLQFIAETQQDGIYENYIIGPLEKLFDLTVPFFSSYSYLDSVIYSNSSFESHVDPNYFKNSRLADLNNDGINTLFLNGSEYAINDSLTLISDNPFSGIVENGEINSPDEFIDIDGDGDLDIIINDAKTGSIIDGYGGGAFYENTGTPESPYFIRRDDDIHDIYSRYESTTLNNFLDYFHTKFNENFPSQYEYPLVYDFDSDNDLDLLMFNKFNHLITYFERSQKNGTSIYSEPFNILPVNDNAATWITDFDTDGDLDLLAQQRQEYSEVLFYERISSNPIQYAEPIILTNFPRWPSYFFDEHSHSSIAKSNGLFKDLDNDGIQEMLTLTSHRDGFEIVLLKKQEDNSFEQIILSQNNEFIDGTMPSLEFVNSSNDGKYDIAFQLWHMDTDVRQPILLFEQQESLNYSAPDSLDFDALELDRSWQPYLDIDLDHDGDTDRVYNHSVTWNLESNPGSITNFSTRAHVDKGSNILIGGFIIEGQSPQTVILRGIGPSLSDHGVQGPLRDPELYLFSGQKLIASNDDWQSLNDADKIESAGCALEHPNEAALRMRLTPGAYTVHLKGKPGDTGIGIIAIDTDNQMPTNSTQVNISGRALVNEGESLTIGGFIIEGDTPVKVLVRGLGPSLQRHGVENALADPTLTLFSGNTAIASNNNWKNSANAPAIAVLAIAPTDDREAAILTELEPGAYTVHLRGSIGGSGVGIIAIDRL
jgi:hypothetical protein